MKRKDQNRYLVILCIVLVLNFAGLIIFNHLPNQSIRRYLALGNEYLLDGNYDKAILNYQAAVNISPSSENSIRSRQKLGDAYCRKAEKKLNSTAEGPTEEECLEAVNYLGAAALQFQELAEVQEKTGKTVVSQVESYRRIVEIRTEQLAVIRENDVEYDESSRDTIIQKKDEAQQKVNELLGIEEDDSLENVKEPDDETEETEAESESMEDILSESDSEKTEDSQSETVYDEEEEKAPLDELYYYYDSSEHTLYLRQDNQDGYTKQDMSEDWGWWNDYSRDEPSVYALKKAVIETPIRLTESTIFSENRDLAEIEGLELLDTSEMTDMSSMFYQCWALRDLDLSTFDTSKVTDMSWMFNRCIGLEHLNISGWEVSQVQSVQAMFYSSIDRDSTENIEGFEDFVTNLTCDWQMLWDQ